MNKIVEEAMTNMICRIEVNELEIIKLKQKIQQYKQLQPQDSLASKKQIDYLRSLGGRAFEGITKDQAGEAINTLLEEKKNKEIDKVVDDIVEPEEVDTDNAGLNEEDLM